MRLRASIMFRNEWLDSESAQDYARDNGPVSQALARPVPSLCQGAWSVSTIVAVEQVLGAVNFVVEVGVESRESEDGRMKSEEKINAKAGRLPEGVRVSNEASSPEPAGAGMS